MDSLATAIDARATPEDVDGITQSCRDYVEGWYNADPERVRRCLHPHLVKRTLMRDPQTGMWILRRPSDAKMMVTFTQRGGGADTAEAERTHQITIQDVFRHIACAKIMSPQYLDYVQLAKLEERWLIVNVLWELREGEITQDE